jgi:hypothetical protein
MLPGYNIGFSYRHYVQLTGGPGYSGHKADLLQVSICMRTAIAEILSFLPHLPQSHRRNFKLICKVPFDLNQ